MTFGNFEKYEEKVAEGQHKVIIAKVEDKETKLKNGRGLLLGLSITEGTFKGQMITEWLGYEHENPQAQAIGRRNLDQIAKAIGYDGIENLSDLDQLKGKVLTVDLKKEVDSYGTKSKVKNWNPKVAVVPKTADSVPF